jgi:hypothetical protein
MTWQVNGLVLFSKSEAQVANHPLAVSGEVAGAGNLANWLSKALYEPLRVACSTLQLSSAPTNNAFAGPEKLSSTLWGPCASLFWVNQKVGMVLFYIEIVEAVVALLFEPLTDLAKVRP